MTLPLWRARDGWLVSLNSDAAPVPAYAPDMTLVEVSKTREALTSDEAIDAAFARVTPYPPDRRSDQYRYTREMVEAALDSVLGEER